MCFMRTTLSIDDDVLSAARHLADRDGKTVGQIVSALARQGLERTAPNRARRVRNGVPLLPAGKATTRVTLELVNQLRDELP